MNYNAKWLRLRATFVDELYSIDMDEFGVVQGKVHVECWDHPPDVWIFGLDLIKNELF